MRLPELLECVGQADRRNISFSQFVFLYMQPVRKSANDRKEPIEIDCVVVSKIFMQPTCTQKFTCNPLSHFLQLVYVQYDQNL